MAIIFIMELPLIINSYRLNLKYHAKHINAIPIYKIYRIPVWNYLGKMLAMPKILWYGGVCAYFGHQRWCKLYKPEMYCPNRHITIQYIY